MSDSTPELNVLIGEDIGAANLERLRTQFPSVEFHYCMEDAAWLETAPKAQVIFSKRFPAAAMAKTEALRWVQAGTAGVDHLLRAGLPEPLGFSTAAPLRPPMTAARAST